MYWKLHALFGILDDMIKFDDTNEKLVYELSWIYFDVCENHNMWKYFWNDSVDSKIRDSDGQIN